MIIVVIIFCQSLYQGTFESCFTCGRCSLPLRAKKPSSGEAGHRALYAFFGGEYISLVYCPSHPSRPALPAPWQRRCESSTGYHMAPIQVEALESESGPLGERQRSRRFSTGRCNNYISSVWDLPLYRRQTPQNHSSPRGSTLFPLCCPPLTLSSLFLVFFFPPLPPDQDKPSCGCVCGVYFFFSSSWKDNC